MASGRGKQHATDQSLGILVPDQKEHPFSYPVSTGSVTCHARSTSVVLLHRLSVGRGRSASAANIAACLSPRLFSLPARVDRQVAANRARRSAGLWSQDPSGHRLLRLPLRGPAVGRGAFEIPSSNTRGAQAAPPQPSRYLCRGQLRRSPLGGLPPVARCRLTPRCSGRHPCHLTGSRVLASTNSGFGQQPSRVAPLNS